MDETVLVFDDDCGFCTWWAEFFEDHADVRIVGFSSLDASLRERLPPNYEDCSHLVTDSAVYSCGESLEQALLLTDADPALRPVVESLRQYDGYNDFREWGYRRVANTRDVWGKFLSKTPPVRRSGGGDSDSGR